MRQHAREVLLLTALAFSLLCAARAQAAAKWTFMVYMDGDNNLESAAINDFLEMASVGSSADVNIAVLFDRIPGEDTRYENWTDTRRGLVWKSAVPTMSFGGSVGELNMGDPSTLTNFVTWAIDSYPAERYALVFWNHGSGWRGAELEAEPDLPMKSVCTDDTSGDRLYMSEVHDALHAIEASRQQLDLVGFDACIMGMAEVAYEIREHAGIMVASEMLVPNAGWPYDTILADLAATPTMSATSFGSVIVDRYTEEYFNAETMSSVRLNGTGMAVLKDRVNTFSHTLRTQWNVRRGACAAAAQGLIVSLRDSILDQTPLIPGAFGLAVYFPEAAGNLNADYTNGVIRFTQDTEWDDFLLDFYANMGGSWVATARANAREFDMSVSAGWQGHHADLWDFCEEIVELCSDTLWVDFAYSGYEDGGYWSPYNTLAEAVTAAATGMTICIKAGTSSETITITKGVYIEAAGGSVLIGD